MQKAKELRPLNRWRMYGVRTKVQRKLIERELKNSEFEGEKPSRRGDTHHSTSNE